MREELSTAMPTDGGFLIVKTFRRMHRDYARGYSLTRDFYAIPRIDLPPEDHAIQYHGLARDPLQPLLPKLFEWFLNEGEEPAVLLAQVRMFALEQEGKVHPDRSAHHLEDAIDIRDRLGTERPDYEIVWARRVEADLAAPVGFRSLGFEPSWFGGQQFSALCDCLAFPRWHGTDVEGRLFLDFSRQLNRHGLFDEASVARAFLDYYLSFDWTERGTYHIAEVFGPTDGLLS